MTVAVGFSPRLRTAYPGRRGATRGRFNRRAATLLATWVFRGLKPTATIGPSLRDARESASSSPKTAKNSDYIRRVEIAGPGWTILKCGGSMAASTHPP